MRRRIQFITLCFLGAAWAPPAVAQDVTPACHGTDLLAELEAKSPETYQQVMDDGRKVPNTQAEFWRIEKPGIPPSYLFGTMHLSDARITDLSGKVKDAIAQSKSVALELADVSDASMAAAMTKSAPLLAYTDGRSLNGRLSVDEYQKTERVISKAGLPIEAAAVLRPWLISMLLSTSECERQQAKSGATALDLHISAEAKKNGLTVTGLETIEQQFAAMASIPENQQLEMLKFDLKNADRANDLMETLVQIYLKRQIGVTLPLQVYLLRQAGFPETTFDGFKKFLLFDRNVRMRDAALPLLDKGSVFIAVGALHLAGDKGLVALLREQGFTVTAVE